MQQSNRFALPLLEAGQAQKEITHNEAVLAVDRLLHLSVTARAAAPPAGPASGASWIVMAGATGAWAGNADAVANWDGYGWVFQPPLPGLLAWIETEACFSVYRDGAWSTGLWPAKGLLIDGRALFSATPASVVAPSGGSVVDIETRAALTALLATLRSQGVIA